MINASYTGWNCPPRASLKDELALVYSEEFAAPIRQLGLHLLEELNRLPGGPVQNQFEELTRAPDGNLALEHFTHLKFFEDIFRGEKLSMLDLCCGNGEFSFLAGRNGHAVTCTRGFDRVWKPMQATLDQQIHFLRMRRGDESQRIYGIRPRVLAIRDLTPMRLPKKSFDVIYVNQCTIHYPLDGREGYWDARHWSFFLQDLCESLTERGMIFVTLAHSSEEKLDPYRRQFAADYGAIFPYSVTTSAWPMMIIDASNRHLVPEWRRFEPAEQLTPSAGGEPHARAGAEGDELYLGLKSGRPQSVALDGEWSSRDVGAAVDSFFELVKDGALTELNGAPAVEEAFFPFGEESPEIRGFRVRGPRINYDRQILFEEPGESENGVVREKIYLNAASFEGTGEFWSRHESLRLIPGLYAAATRRADAIGPRLLEALGGVEPHDQLMFIRYSTTSSDPEVQKRLAAFGSRRLGVNHDDETFFSLHIFESAPELYCWNYPARAWIPRAAGEGQAEVLLGDLARYAGYPPTTHRLVPVPVEGSVRHSLIFERAPGARELKEILDPEHFETAPPAPAGDSDETALCIVKSSRWQAATPEVERLTEDHLRIWLFFRIRSFKNRIFRIDPATADLKAVAARGFKKALLIESGLLLESESFFDQLIRNARVFSEKALFKLDRKFGPSCMLLNLENGNATAADEILRRHGFGGLADELPTHLDTLSGAGDGRAFHMRSYGRHADLTEPLKLRRNLILEHLNQGFAYAFTFNNESYREVDRMPPPKETRDLFGLASGFKLNYILERARSEIRTLNYFDLNVPALTIKKRMLETWDGRDLTDWLIRHGFLNGEKRWIVEKSADETRRLWHRELDIWGGAEAFAANWRRLRNLDVTFHHLDLVQEQERLLALLDGKPHAAMWISNVWHNEFMSHAFPDDRLTEVYRRWMTRLEEKAPDLTLYQGGVAIEGRLFEATGMPVRQLIKQIETEEFA